MSKADAYLPPTSEKFYEGLLGVYEALGKIKITLPKGCDANKIVDNAKQEGATAISCCPPILQEIQLKKCLDGVVELLKKYQPEEEDVIDESVKLVEGKSDINQLIEQTENSIAASALVTYILKPFLMEYGREVMKDFPESYWMRKGYCPVCGQHPVFSYFSKDENGKRYLICSLCETRWPFARVACYNCLEEDTDKLGYFRIDSDEEQDYRVSFCRSCKSYLKTFDQKDKKYKPESILKEDIKTAHLDYLAQKEGFTQ